MRLLKTLPDSLARKMERLKWQMALAKSPLFDTDWYLAQNPDVKAAGINPLKHYLSIGWREMRDPCAEFDGAYYLTRYPDVASLGVPPLVHYWLHGRHEGRHLNPSLDLRWIGDHHQQMRDSTAEAPSSKAWTGTDQSPYISVIIPTYNRIRLLPTVIEAWRLVDRETPFPYEIIFSDDGSEDGSVEYLEQLEGLPLRVLRNDHGGASKARNTAIQAAKGERLLIIGDDIFPDPQLLNVHARLARSLGKNVATLGVVDWANNLTVNHLMQHITEIGNEQFSYNRLPDQSFVDFRHFYTCNICVDKDLILQEKKIFDDRFDQYGFEDIELGYRLSLKGMKIFYTTEAKGDHYHPYIVEGFCKRQICAGRMAVVFRDAHPGVGKILGIDALEALVNSKSIANSRAGQQRWQKRLDALVQRCNALEKAIEQGNNSVKKLIGTYLSTIYSTLFRAMYEYGVLQRIAKSDQVLSIAMERNFSELWNEYWALIESHSAQDLELALSDSHNLLDALVLKDPSVLPALQTQPAAFQELLLLEALNSTPNPTNNRRLHLQRMAGRVLYWLVNDPRYLFRRILETYRSRTQSTSSAPRPANAPVNPRLVLILKRGNPDSSALEEHFTHLMGDRASIAWLSEQGQLTPEEYAQPGNCYFRPSSLANFPHRDHLLGAWLALMENRVDISLISYGLENDGNVIHASLQDQMVFSERVREAVLQGNFDGTPFTGKIYRTEPSQKRRWQKSSLDELFGTRVSFNEHNSLFSTQGKVPTATSYTPSSLFPAAKNRPTIFVFPVFVAVGGVERNTVEIIRRLEQTYDFVVITMERLRQEQGSLASQFQEAGARLIEMSEIVVHDDYLRVLLKLKKWLKPDLVWICNGSPWLCDNAQNLRTLFHDIPIVDQEVYDVNEGWINRYHEPGIQSFDRFIAINRKIEQKFVDFLNIKQEKVDLIYSAVNTQRIIDYKHNALPPEQVKAKLGLPEGKKIFTFVGRLTAQKRPVEFLKIAQSRQALTDEVFVLVGDGELAQQCHDFIGQHRLTNVICIPYVANTLELASVTDGLIITSAYEGLPIAMLEVISFAVPVFSTDVGDIALVLQDYQAGMTIPVEAQESERLTSLCAWMEKLFAYRSNLRKHEQEIMERFSSQKISEQYIDCFYKASIPYLEQATT
ncbi:glycosyltransferase [Pseudomonas sp. R3.Fl]|uniref:glycosyltransferase n=1 Tax=Pseudomonas sp. R3.Fl TaxID=2928708 RepID=UPI00201E0FC2|nr:glycosyltransferase [Pseudomonas sp. R3.Fl]MCL6690573.1 glycosyltransferase [Pseudomonas sp. R3.Fl]